MKITKVTSIVDITKAPLVSGIKLGPNLLSGIDANWGVDEVTLANFNTSYTWNTVSDVSTITTDSNVLTCTSSSSTDGISIANVFPVSPAGDYRVEFNVSARTNAWKIVIFRSGYFTAATINTIGQQSFDITLESGDLRTFYILSFAGGASITIDCSVSDMSIRKIL